jgi:hypothetical protein
MLLRHLAMGSLAIAAVTMFRVTVPADGEAVHKDASKGRGAHATTWPRSTALSAGSPALTRLVTGGVGGGGQPQHQQRQGCHSIGGGHLGARGPAGGAWEGRTHVDADVPAGQAGTGLQCGSIRCTRLAGRSATHRVQLGWACECGSQVVQRGSCWETGEVGIDGLIPCRFNLSDKDGQNPLLAPFHSLRPPSPGHSGTRAGHATIGLILPP